MNEKIWKHKKRKDTGSFMLRPFNRLQRHLVPKPPQIWNEVIFSGIWSSFYFPTNISVILLHQKYYLAILQASKLAYKDVVICLTLVLNLNFTVVNALPVIKQRKCFT